MGPRPAAACLTKVTVKLSKRPGAKRRPAAQACHLPSVIRAGGVLGALGLYDHWQRFCVHYNPVWTMGHIHSGSITSLFTELTEGADPLGTDRAPPPPQPGAGEFSPCPRRLFDIPPSAPTLCQLRLGFFFLLLLFVNFVSFFCFSGDCPFPGGHSHIHLATR